MLCRIKLRISYKIVVDQQNMRCSSPTHFDVNTIAIAECHSVLGYCCDYANKGHSFHLSTFLSVAFFFLFDESTSLSSFGFDVVLIYHNIFALVIFDLFPFIFLYLLFVVLKRKRFVCRWHWMQLLECDIQQKMCDFVHEYHQRQQRRYNFDK